MTKTTVLELASSKNKFESYRFPPRATVIAAHEFLDPLVGTEVHVGDWLCITQNCINDFSKVTGDRQQKAHADSPFGSTIAHGVLLISLIPRLQGFNQGNERYWGRSRLTVINDLTAVRFLTPVKAGASIRSRTKLLSVVANKRSLDIREEVSVYFTLARNTK